PCVLPVVQVSNLTYGAIPASLVANPNHPNEMVLATDDGNCGSGEGFYSTRDGGSTWPGHSCIAPRDYAFGGDIGYDLNNRIFAGDGDGDAILTLRYSDNNGVLWSRARVLG